MKPLALACAALLALASSAVSVAARADEAPPPAARTPQNEERAVGKARELLERARFLDEAATADEKAAADLTARLPNLRIAAKAARDRATRAREGDADREALLARAEDLEIDVAVSEAEVSVKKRGAVDNRRVARDLRARALRLLREGIVEETAPTTSSLYACDPPFRYTADGRKIYRIECLR